MIEFAICLPFIVLLFTGIVFFGRGFVIAQRAGMAARYAAWRVAKNTDTTAAQIQPTVRKVYGLDLNVEMGTLDWEWDVEGILSFVSAAGSGKRVSVTYMYEPNFVVFDPGAINIAQSVVVDGGTWCFDEWGSDNLIGLLINALFDLLREVGLPSDIVDVFEDAVLEIVD